MKGPGTRPGSNKFNERTALASFWTFPAGRDGEDIMKTIATVILVLCLGLFITPAFALRFVSVITCEDVSKDLNPLRVTDRFTPDSPVIHAVLVFQDARPGTKIRGSWVAVDAIETRNYEIHANDVIVKGSEDTAHFELSKPDKGWPAGNYRLDISVDDKFVMSAPFRVVKVSGQAPPSPSQQGRTRPSDPAQDLLGSWQCVTANGIIPIIFQSQNQLLFNGESAQYLLVPGAIRVQENNGLVDYPYKLEDARLSIGLSDGRVIRCARGESSQQGLGGMSSPPSGGQEHLLSGRLCNYASSGSGYGSGSSSTSRWASFDGRGNFSYGSESSFSSRDGLAYGNNPANSGRYRVSGNLVYLQFSDGSTETAQVYNRNRDGSIAELTYGGKLYAKAMCGT
jgi:hypothetical protein